MPSNKTALVAQLQRAVPAAAHAINESNIWQFADRGGYLVDVPGEWRTQLMERMKNDYKCETEFDSLPRLAMDSSKGRGAQFDRKWQSKQQSSFASSSSSSQSSFASPRQRDRPQKHRESRQSSTAKAGYEGHRKAKR
jgi:hypothetical protein